MKKYDKLLAFMVFALIACIIAAGSVSAADTGNNKTNTTGLANTPYAEYGGDNNHTGQSNYTGPQANTTKWTKNLSQGTEMSGSGATVIGSDGTIYTTSSDGKLYAISPDGTVLWNYSVGQLQSTPAVGNDGTIYVATTTMDNPQLCAISSKGALIWNCSIASSSPPVIGPDGTIYIVSQDSNTQSYLNAVNSTNGSIKWTYPSNDWDSGCSVPVIGSDGTIYFSSASNLYAITDKGDSAEQKWVYANPTGTFMGNSPSIGPYGTIYIGSDDGTLYAINPNTGDKKWTYNIGNSLFGSPSIASDGTIYVVNNNGNLYAINNGGTSAEQKWKYNIGAAAYASWPCSVTIGADGALYVGTSVGAGKGNFYALSPDGNLKWSYNTAAINSNWVIGSDGSLYIGNINGTLYAFKDIIADFTTHSLTVTFADASTGSPKSWYWNFGDGTTSTDKNPTHTYSKSGTYTVTLTVTSSNGTKDTKNQTIRVTDTTAPTASANINSGIYNTNKAVTLYMSENGAIYYTLDGTNPTTSSTRYTGPITITSTKILKYIAVDEAGNTSPVYTAAYTIDKIAPVISAVNPKNKATGISRTSTISIKLSENILKSTNLSKIYIKNIKTGKKIKATIKISGNHIYITTSKKSANTWYQVYIPLYSVKDAAGNNLAKAYTWKFKTGKK